MLKLNDFFVVNFTIIIEFCLATDVKNITWTNYRLFLEAFYIERERFFVVNFTIVFCSAADVENITWIRYR